MEIGSCASQVVGDGLEQKMEALKTAGFDFIEPAWREAEVPNLGASYGEELRQLGERTGCPVRSAILATFVDLGARVQTDEGRARELDIFARASETLSAAGGDVLLLPNYAATDGSNYDELYTSFLQEAGAHAATVGVKLGIEHIPASKYRNSAVKVYELVEMVNLENVGVYFDIANGLYIDEDPLEAAQKIAARVVQYHVKDYKPGGRSFESMPLQEVKAVMESAGFKGRVATEIDPIEESGQKTNAHLTAALAVLRQRGF